MNADKASKRLATFLEKQDKRLKRDRKYLSGGIKRELSAAGIPSLKLKALRMPVEEYLNPPEITIPDQTAAVAKLFQFAQPKAAASSAPVTSGLYKYYDAKGTPGDNVDHGGGGFSWKNLGSNILKSFTVPQAPLAVAFDVATGGDFDPGQLLGAFDKDYRGFQSGLENLGAPKGLAVGLGIGLDIVVDPLWLLGAAAAPVKGGKFLGNAARTASRLRGNRLARAASFSAKLAKEAENVAGAGSRLAKAARAEGVVDEAGNFVKPLDDASPAVREAGKRAGRESVRAESEAIQLQRANLEEEIELATEAAKQPVLRIGFGRKRVRKTIDDPDSGLPTTVDVKLPRGIEVPLLPYKWAEKLPGLRAARNVTATQNPRLHKNILGRAYSQLARPAKELAVAQSKFIQSIKSIYKLDTADSIMVNEALSLRNLSIPKFEKWRADKVAEGVWNPKMDDVIAILSEYSNAQAKSLGFVSWQDQARIMLNLIDNMLQTADGTISKEAEAAMDNFMTNVGALAAGKGKLQDEVGQLKRSMYGEWEETLDAYLDGVRMRNNQARRAETRIYNAKVAVDRARAEVRDAPRTRAKKGERTGGVTPYRRAKEKLDQAQLELRLAQKEKSYARQQAGLYRELAKDAEKEIAKILKENPEAAEELKGLQRALDATTEMLEKLEDDLAKLPEHLGQRADEIMNQLAREAQVFANQYGLTEFTAWGRLRHHILGEEGFQWSPGGKHGLGPEDLPAGAPRGAMDINLMKQKAEWIIAEKGEYWPIMMGMETRKQVWDRMMDMVHKGWIPSKGDAVADGMTHNFTLSRKAPHTYSLVTKERTKAEYIRMGVPEDQAQKMVDDLDKHLDFADEGKAIKGFEDVVDDMPYVPEFDVWTVANVRASSQSAQVLDQELMKLINNSFDLSHHDKPWEVVQQMARDIKTTKKTTPRFPIKKSWPILGKDEEAVNQEFAMYAVGWLKSWYTVMNPGHYGANAAGQLVNNLLWGDIRAAFHSLKGIVPNSRLFGKTGQSRLTADFGQGFKRMGAELPDDVPIAKLDALRYKIGGKEVTGLEVAFMSRMSGLGTSYTQADIGDFVDLVNATGKFKGPKRLRNMMNKFNLNRENGMRLDYFVGHLKRGDDILSAQAKVIRTHFDYDDLTEFEKIWMRNMFLFYTWFKNNLILQASSIFARPGMYSAWADIERARPKDPNEPEWLKEAGAIGSPIGALLFSNPVAEVYRWGNYEEEGIWGGFRSNVLGMVNPFVRVPVELAFNKSAFTGGPIEKFEGQQKVHWSAILADKLGIPVSQSRRQAEETGTSGAIDPKVAHVLDAILGPQGSIFNVGTDPERDLKPATIAGRLIGIRPTPDQPEKWRRSRDAIERAEKAAKTRKRTYER